MPDYLNGKIYKIVDNTNGNLYIGSTTQSLTQRLAGHVGKYKSYEQGKYPFTASFDILKNGNYEIILIEEVECENKEQLLREERKQIDSNLCVNRNIPSRTAEEWRKEHKEHIVERNRNYYKINHAVILEKLKQYQENHIHDKQEYDKKYYLENEQKKREYANQYREANKEIVNEKKAIKFTCVCGAVCRKGGKSAHLNSQKHLKFLLDSNLE